MTTWILIADASRARLFATEDGAPRLRLLRELEHQASRAKEAEIVTDKNGGARWAARPGFSTMSPRVSPKEMEAVHFAQELAGVLREGHEQRSYDALALAAPPHFLGLLRGELHPPVAKSLVTCLDRDYTRVPDRELPEHLAPIMEAVAQARMRQ